MDIDLKAVNKAITKAKLSLMLGSKTTFFSALLANLRLIITTDLPAAATNGIELRINPNFVLQQTKATLLGLFLHEIMHVALDHCNMIMYKDLDQDILNIAMDHHINLYITTLGYEIPLKGYCDTKYRNMSSMEIYHDLMKNPPDTSDIDRDVFGCPSDMTTEEHAEAITTNIVKAVQQAQMAKDPGSIPGDLLRRLDDVLNPKLPWETILANYLNDYSKDDYSRRRPNRRFLPDFYMPTLYSQSLKQITAGADVSCSMEPDDLSRIFHELVYIWDVMKPERMRAMTFDTKVHLNEVFTEGDRLTELELMGGGGTNVQPLLDSIREEEPVFALIFTDGYFKEPNMAGIHTDVYWIINGNPGFKPPHGIVIPFN